MRVDGERFSVLVSDAQRGTVDLASERLHLGVYQLVLEWKDGKMQKIHTPIEVVPELPER